MRREPDLERDALAAKSLAHFNKCAVQFRDSIDDGKAETAAACVGRLQAGHTVKTIEDQ